MKINDFLNDIISSQDIKKDDEEIKKLQDEREKVQTLVNDSYGDTKKMIRYGGSYAKDTMIRDSFDLDILCYFHADETTAGNTLEEIYDNLKEVLSEEYYIDPKRSAIRLKNKDDEVDFHIDFVPGRFVEGKEGDAFLYQKGAEKDRLKTNPDKHIKYIKESQLTDIIKLIKIWKCIYNIDLKTFILELLIVKILKDSKKKSISEKLEIFFTKIKDEVGNMTIEDPANSNNDLSELFDQKIRDTLKQYAQTAIDNIEEEDWLGVFDNKFEIDDETEESDDNKSLALMDISHCQQPKWLISESPCSVEIRCFIKDKNGEDREELKSDDKNIVDDLILEYRAEVSNCFDDYDIYWQVVNTGYHAERDDGLRGEFFKGKDLVGDLTEDQRLNYEFSMYRGKHWIECFIVRDNNLLARSGRFYVNILPTFKKPRIKKRNSIPYYRRKY